MARMVRKQIYIDDRQEQLLKTEAERTGQTESQLIRDAIERAYDDDFERRRRDRLWEQWERGAHQIAELIREESGDRPPEKFDRESIQRYADWSPSRDPD